MSRICLVLVVILFVGASGDDSISCSANSFNGAAEIICHFNTPVNNNTHEAIIISYYPTHNITGQAGQKRHVLDCDWEESGKLLCEEEQGYKRKNDTDITKLTLNIPNATEIHQGNYTCELVPPKDYRSTHCHLIIKVSKTLEEEVPKEGTKTKPNIGSTTNTSSDNGTGSTDKSDSGRTDLEIGLIVFSVFVTTICIIFVVLYCRRRRKRTSRAMTTAPQTIHPLQPLVNPGVTNPNPSTGIGHVQGHQATLSGSKATLSGSKATLSGSKATLSGSTATLSGSTATSSESKATSSESKATSSESKATLSESKATLSESKATLSGFKATSSESKATLSGSKATLSKSEAEQQPPRRRLADVTATSSEAETDSSVRPLLKKRKPRKLTNSERSQSGRDNQIKIENESQTDSVTDESDRSEDADDGNTLSDDLCSNVGEDVEDPLEVQTFV